MSLRQNVASQHVVFRVWNDTNDQGITGDVAQISMFVSVNGAALVAAAFVPVELSAANAPGYYRMELNQGETNGRSIIVVGNSSTANAEVQGQVFHPDQWAFNGIAFDSIQEIILAVLANIATKTSTGVEYKLRDGTTTKLAVTHDTLGNRTGSTIT